VKIFSIKKFFSGSVSNQEIKDFSRQESCQEDL